GADVPIEKVISIKEFPTLVDDESWAELMPQGVTKTIFKKFVEYYDADVFAEAGTQIRKLAKSADKLPPTRRVQQIARIFSYFKNPDKETVLTPWRVVNMHLADTIGGCCFYDESYEKPIEEPRLVGLSPRDSRNASDGRARSPSAPLFSIPDAKILEINSKSGLYPLYVVYSLYRRKLGDVPEDAVTPAALAKLWREVVARSLFVVCKTPMARAITRRTLVGYDDKATVNAQYIKNLVEMLKNEPKKFYNKVCGGNAWNNKEFEMKMLKFDAVVGNPPYQVMGGSGGTNDAPIFQYFADAASSITTHFVSLIIPAKWFAAGRESQLKAFRERMLGCGHIRKLFAFADAHSLFPTAEIKGGVCYYLEDSDYKGNCEYTLEENGETITSNIALNEFPVFIRNPKVAAIVKKVRDRAIKDGVGFVDSIISADTPFGIPTNPSESKKTPFAVSDKKTSEFDTIVYYLVKGKRVTGYVRGRDIVKNAADVKFDKVFIPKAGGSGADPYVLSKPELAPKKSVCSQTYLYAKFDSKYDANVFVSYLRTKFFRFMVSSLKITQDALSKVYAFVPLQDFTTSSDIDWSCTISEIDAQLYAKYGLTKPEQKFIESMIKPMEG
ncbi:MAG: Eco57I restriction-modification methylase domain-containing protein, partial [Kiritimatiellae bacterium]|nr:Eco57I restriction-modification methylase domain-containing protein [Kiritimatiellia bacterium]